MPTRESKITYLNYILYYTYIYLILIALIID